MLFDLDDSRNPDTGELTGFASSIVKRLNSFTEISIGKAGLHVVVRGQVERTRMHTRKNWAGQQIEIKPYGCFMTVSGNRLESTPREVQDRQSELSALYEEIFKEEPEPATRRAKNTQAARGDSRIDRSACNYALCCELAKAGMTDERIEQLLRDEPIMGKKWRERSDYRKRTIDAARKSLR